MLNEWHTQHPQIHLCIFICSLFSPSCVVWKCDCGLVRCVLQATELLCKQQAMIDNLIAQVNSVGSVQTASLSGSEATKPRHSSNRQKRDATHDANSAESTGMQFAESPAVANGVHILPGPSKCAVHVEEAHTSRTFYEHENELLRVPRPSVPRLDLAPFRRVPNLDRRRNKQHVYHGATQNPKRPQPGVASGEFDCLSCFGTPGVNLAGTEGRRRGAPQDRAKEPSLDSSQQHHR